MERLRKVALGGALIAAGFSIASYMLYVPDAPVEELIPMYGNPTTTASKFININGMSVHYRLERPSRSAARGAANALPTIVLVHGTSSSLHTWNEWTEALVDTHHRNVLRFDLPGFGLTGPSPQHVKGYTSEAYVEFVFAVIDAVLGKDARFVIAGNSLGGSVAWTTAVEAVHRTKKGHSMAPRVAGLVLVDAAGYPKSEKTSLPIAFRIAQVPFLAKIVQYILPWSMVSSSVRKCYGTKTLGRLEGESGSAIIQRYYDMGRRAGNRKALFERFEAEWPWGRRQAEVKDVLGKAGIPTLIIWGDEDQLIPIEHAERFHREIEGSELAVFKGFGHVPMEEDADVTVKRFHDFLLKHKV